MSPRNSQAVRTSGRKNSVQFETVIEILRAAGRVRRRVTQFISPHGLTLSQYNALRILRGAPEGLTTMEVRDRLIERSPGITRIIDGLLKKGLVRRDSYPGDRRSVLCVITKAGLELLGVLDGPIDQTDRELLKELTAAEAKQLAELLSRVGDEG